MVDDITVTGGRWVQLKKSGGGVVDVEAAPQAPTPLGSLTAPTVIAFQFSHMNLVKLS